MEYPTHVKIAGTIRAGADPMARGSRFKEKTAKKTPLGAPASLPAKRGYERPSNLAGRDASAPR